MIGKKILNKSEKLHAEYLRSVEVDNTRQISEIEGEIWSLRNEREKQLFLTHEREAEEIKVRMDILRSSIVNLNSKKQNEATNRLLDLRNFNRKHLKTLQERLIRAYERLERLKFRKTEKTADTQIFGLLIKIRTNVRSVMAEQLRISELFQKIMIQARPLGYFVEKIAEIEKDRKRDFQAVTVTLHESERFALQGFIVEKENLDALDFRINILHPQLLRQRIQTVDILAKPRNLSVAA